MAVAPRYGFLGSNGRYADTLADRLDVPDPPEPAWLDAKSWGSWGSDRTVRRDLAPLPPRPVHTSDTDPYTPCFFPQRLLGALHVKGQGNIGMEQLPGKKLDGYTGHQDRDLAKDLARVREAGITHVVTLVETFELAKCRQPCLFAVMRSAGFSTKHAPLADLSTPGDLRAFNRVVRDIARRVKRGERVLIHCRGGYGRTGLLAACVLVFLGLNPDKAVARTREARPRTIETKAQEAFVYTYAAKLAEARANVEL